MRTKINIANVNKAALLAELYNNSRPMGMGFLQARDGVMTEEQALEVIKEGDDSARMFPTLPKKNLDFDYLFGRPLKIDLSGEEVDPWGYDRDNGGDGSFQRCLDTVIAKSK